MVGFRADQLVTSFGLGIVVGLILAYFIDRHLDNLKYQNDMFYEHSVIEQRRSLESTHETLQQFRDNPTN